MGKAPGVLEELRLSAAAYEAWKTRLLGLRNELAHGRNLLTCVSEPIEAIDLFGEVRRFAERLWEIAPAATRPT